MYRQPREADS